MPTICKTENCNKYAMYGPAEGKSRVACSKHKTADMICKKVDSRKCVHCDKRPSFALPGEKAKYCKDHIPGGEKLINVSAKLCEVCKEHQPSFGLLDGKPTHCAKCAKLSKEKLYDLISVLCDHESGCRKNPTKGFPGEKPRRCKAHAEDGMVDVKNKKCALCDKQATFGVDKATHCKDHKEEHMKDRKHDAVNCEICDKRATFGIERPERCLYHKDEDMKDLVSVMCSVCQECQPAFNFKGKKAEFCLSCKEDGMIDVKHTRCGNCDLYQVSKEGGLCSMCNPSARKKVKEMEVVDYVKELGYEFIHDKAVKGCKYRPDILMKGDAHCLIVEVDEKQHCQLEETAEVIRMMSIQQALKKPVIFIRYNPDVYRIKGKISRLHTKTRLEHLGKQLEFHYEAMPFKPITAYKMYYDDHEFIEWDITSIMKGLLKGEKEALEAEYAKLLA